MNRAAFALIVTVFVASCTAPPTTDDAKIAEIESMYAEYKASFPGVRDITAREFMTLDRDAYVVVDVREPEERSVSTIAGSISKDEYESKADQYVDKTVITYCTIGYRSGLYAEELAAQGASALNLKGSILAWAHEGGGFVDEQGGATTRVHVYGSKWNLLPDGYEAVWD